MTEETGCQECRGEMNRLLGTANKYKTALNVSLVAMQDAIEALGAPTMDYEPAIAAEEYQKSINKSSKAMLDALKHVTDVLRKKEEVYGKQDSIQR